MAEVLLEVKDLKVHFEMKNGLINTLRGKTSVL